MEITLKIITSNRIEIKTGELKALVAEIYHNKNIDVIDNTFNFISVETIYGNKKIYCNEEQKDQVFEEFKRLVIGE